MSEPASDKSKQLRKPLEFVARNGFRNLSRVKDLGSTLLEMARGDPALAEFSRLAADVDTLDGTAKRERIEDLLELLSVPASEPRPLVPSTAKSADPSSLPLTSLKGVGDKLAVLFADKGLRSVRDLLFFLPRRYEDRRLRSNVRDAPVGQRVTIEATIRALGPVPLRHGKKLFEMAVSDPSGVLRCKWFRFYQGQFKSLTPGMNVAVSGVVDLYAGQKQMVHPDVVPIEDGEHQSDLPVIVPVYSEVTGVHQKKLIAVMAKALPHASGLPEVLPGEAFPGQPTLVEALAALHRPEADVDVGALETGRSRWHERLILEELLVLQLGLIRRRLNHKLEPAPAFGDPKRAAPLAKQLFPFALTAAQQRVAREILLDLARPVPMHRLVQGDVGSGKTAVAFLAVMQAFSAGHQAALMAPTELLAEQHFKNAVRLLAGHGVRVGFLSSSATAAKKTLAAIERGDIDLAIGTHALIQDRVEFKSLGLAIVDEQHRFGVVQRAQLKQKGSAGLTPHLLVMTATPIPRTLALTVYGDLDVSLIDELPPGRTPIATGLVRETERQKLYSKLRAQLAAGRQVYVVYPLIEESEKLALKDATQMAEALRLEFPEFPVELLHGRMPSEDKDAVMRRFAAAETKLLVSTTVIEVGIDVANATVMVIEHAERFGLSQLHQLRGRVGRGAHQSFCYLVSGFVNEDAFRRLRVLCQTTDGFKVSEEDLAIRGPGDFIGTRQAGLPELGIANLARDQDLLIRAKEAAEKLLALDAELARWPALRRVVGERFARAEALTRAG